MARCAVGGRVIATGDARRVTRLTDLLRPTIYSFGLLDSDSKWALLDARLINFVEIPPCRTSFTLVYDIETCPTVIVAPFADIRATWQVCNPAVWALILALELMVELGDRFSRRWHFAARTALRLLLTCLARIFTSLAVSLISITIEAIFTLIDACVAIEEGIVSEATITRCTCAATILSTGLAFVVAGDALIRLFVGALWTIWRALEVVEYQILINRVARRAHIRLTREASQAWVPTCELKIETVSDRINRILGCRICVCGHLPAGCQHGVLHQDLLVCEGQRELEAWVLLCLQDISDLNDTRLGYIIDAVDVNSLFEDASDNGLANLWPRPSIDRLKLIDIVLEQDG